MELSVEYIHHAPSVGVLVVLEPLLETQGAGDDDWITG